MPVVTVVEKVVEKPCSACIQSPTPATQTNSKTQIIDNLEVSVKQVYFQPNYIYIDLNIKNNNSKIQNLTLCKSNSTCYIIDNNGTKEITTGAYFGNKNTPYEQDTIPNINLAMNINFLMGSNYTGKEIKFLTLQIYNNTTRQEMNFQFRDIPIN